MRLPLVVPIMSRDGTLNKDSKLVNVYTEAGGGRAKVFSRPGISTAVNSLVGYGNGIFNGIPNATSTIQFNSAFSVVDGTLGKITSDGFASGSDYNLGNVFPLGNVTSGFIVYYNNSWYLTPRASIVYKSASIDNVNWSLHKSTAAVTFDTFSHVVVSNGSVYGIYGPLALGPYVIWKTSDLSTWVSTDIYDAVSSAFNQRTIDAVTEAAGTVYIFQDQDTVPRMAYSATPDVSSSWVALSTSGIPLGAGAQYGTLNSNLYRVGGQQSGPVTVASVYKSAGLGTAASSWSLLTASPGFQPRINACVLAWKGYLVVSGGLVTTAPITFNRELWMSSNGTSWVSSEVTNISTMNKYKSGFASDEVNRLVLYHLSTGPSTSTSTNIIVLSSLTQKFSQTTISTISNPNNVQIDFMAGE